MFFRVPLICFFTSTVSLNTPFNESTLNSFKKLLNDLTLNSFKIVPVTFGIVDLSASLRAKRGGKVPDALIVATALNQASEIVYSQDKGLQRFNEDIRICELP